MFDIDKYGFAHHNGQVYERLSDKVGQIIKSVSPQSQTSVLGRF